MPATMSAKQTTFEKPQPIMSAYSLTKTVHFIGYELFYATTMRKQSGYTKLTSRHFFFVFKTSKKALRKKLVFRMTGPCNPLKDKCAFENVSEVSFPEKKMQRQKNLTS